GYAPGHAQADEVDDAHRRCGRARIGRTGREGARHLAVRAGVAGDPQRGAPARRSAAPPWQRAGRAVRRGRADRHGAGRGWRRGAGGVIRGDLWRYDPKGSPRQRTVLIVSADGISNSTRRWVYGLDVVDSDPGDILSVRLGDGRWVNGTSLSRLWRDWLTEQVGTVDND